MPSWPSDNAIFAPTDDTPRNRMKTQLQYVCPRCDHLLVPVHAVEGSKRRVVALTCPEPYCDHVQCLPRELAAELEEEESGTSFLRTNQRAG